MSNEAVAEAPVNAELDALIDSKFREFREGSIVNGTVLDIRPQVVIVDIGYKSEGVIPASEFEDDEIEAETLSDVISKQEAGNEHWGDVKMINVKKIVTNERTEGNSVEIVI